MYNVKDPRDGPSFQSVPHEGKHTDVVWQVCDPTAGCNISRLLVPGIEKQICFKKHKKYLCVSLEQYR